MSALARQCASSPRTLLDEIAAGTLAPSIPPSERCNCRRCAMLRQRRGRISPAPRNGVSQRWDSEIETEVTISGSVGRGGRNSSSDVRRIQSLLNTFISAGALPGVAPLVVDGLVGSKTIAAIRMFQQRVVGMSSPDSRVDPGGRTLRYLNSSSPQPAPTPAPAPAPSAPTYGPPAAGASQVRANAVTIATAELARWNPGGQRRVETDSRMNSILEQYWLAVPGMTQSQAQDFIRSKIYWSAAFISWVMRQAGAGNDFAYSGAHGTYIRAARENRYANNSNPFKAYRISEAAPRLGDIVCYRWKSDRPLDFDLIDGQGYHGDVVTRIAAGSITAVGGNVSQSVSQKTLQLDSQGRIDQARHPTHVAVVRIG